MTTNNGLQTPINMNMLAHRIMMNYYYLQFFINIKPHITVTVFEIQSCNCSPKLLIFYFLGNFVSNIII